MAGIKMNVLVYAGTGSTSESVRHCLYTLRRLLSPNYAVMTVSESVILKEPWAASCALLVFPGGADLGYCRSLNGSGNLRISSYVNRGGAYLGFCAGGYYGSKQCEFEAGDKKMEVVGSRELAFFPGICRGSALKGFVYQSEAGARAPKLKVHPEAFPGGDVPESFHSYYNGGGVFVDAISAKEKGIEVLASYADAIDVDGGDSKAAVIYSKVGEGGVILTGPHPEFAALNLDRNCKVPCYAKIINAVAEDDDARISFVSASLSKLGLRVNRENTSVPSLSTLHLSSLNKIEVSELLDSWKDIITKDGEEEYIKGENDTFRIEKSDSGALSPSLKALSISSPKDSASTNTDEGEIADSEHRFLTYEQLTKRILPHESTWPDGRETPSFNHHAYYANLAKYQSHSNEATEFGRVILYGEVVTSTNTMLDKNTNLLKTLPQGFTSLATTQVSARGRGNNVWVSPAGALPYSICVRHPIHLSTAPVVFIQYIMALAVVIGVKSYDDGYEDMPIKLKWPNDIYAQDPSKSGEYIKIGGVLVISSYTPGEYTLVIGTGINVSNAAPTTSLNSILPPGLPRFTNEKILARILTVFEDLYIQFRRNGFTRQFEELYYQYWLHTDQVVTLEEHGCVRARVKGITRDWGQLRAEELGPGDVPTGRMWELHSDSNSFDFFKGLIRRKT